MPPTPEDQQRLQRLQALLQQPPPQQQEQQEPTPQQAENVRQDSIRASQRTIAAASAELDFGQDKKIQAAVDFATLTPEIAAGHGVTSPVPLSKPPDALGRFNKIREKYGLGPADELPEKIGIIEQAKEDFTDPENIPLVGGFETARQLWNVQAAVKHIEEDKGTAEDWETLAAHMDQSVMDAKERTFGGGVARITLGSIPFWADFFASGGLPAVLKRGGKEVAKKAIKKSLSGALKKAALDVGRLAGTTALRLPVFSHRVAATAFHRATPEYATVIPVEAEDDVEFVVLDEGEEGLEAAKNALGDIYIEVFSEQTGKVVGLIGGKFRRAAGMKPARVGARDFLAKFGVHGVAGEMAEERIGEGLREVATQLGVLDLPQQAPDLEQLAQEAVAFAIPIAGVQAATRFKRDRPTMERARGFVELHPEASERIAALEGRVSRKQLKDAAGDTLSGEQVSQMRRDVFRDMIGAAVEERAQPTSEQQLEQTLMQHQVEVPRDEVVTEPVARQAQEARLQEPAVLPGEDVAGPPVVEPSREVVAVGEVSKFRRKGANPVTAFQLRLFTPAGVLPEGAFDRARESNQWYRARLKEVENLDRDFMAGAKEAYGGVAKMSNDDIEAVNAALGGKPLTSFLPEPLQEPVRALRQKLDELSTQLIKDGIVEGPLAAVIEKNKGLWLHRQYRAFIDPKWSMKTVPVTIRNDFKNWLRQEYLADGIEMTDNQLEQQMGEILFKAKEAGTPIGLFSKLGKKDQSIFIKRKDLPEIYRAFLGEVKDPRFNFIESARKQAHVIATHKFLTEVRKEGLGRYLFEAEDPNIPPEAVAEIAAKNGEAMWPLNGLKTYPEVKEAFERATKSGAVANWHRWYLKATGGAKAAATIFSETTQVRNVLSWNQMFLNTGLLWHFGPRGFMRAARVISDDFRRTPNKERRAAVVRAIELGVLHDGAVSGEMKHALEGAVKGDEAAFADSLYDAARPFHKRAAAKALRGGAKGTAKTVEAAAKLYRAGDDLPRYVMWKMMQARLRKALPDATEVELEEMAARELRDTAPTYSMVPELWRAIGRNAPVAPFTSFPYEIFRTYGNNLKRIGTEFQDPRTRGIAAERLVGAMLVPVTIPAISAVSRMLFSGMDRDQENALREFMPDYAVDGEFHHLPIPDKPHTFRVIDMSYVDPYVYMRGPIMHFLRNQDQDVMRSMAGAAKKFLQPFTSEELLIQRVLNVSRNKTEYGGTVYNEQADWDTQARDVFTHLLGAYEPGTSKQVRRAYRGMRGVIEPWGQVRDPVDEMMAATGQRPMQINIPAALGQKARHFAGNWSEATNILTTHARSQGDVSLDLLRQKHEEMIESKRRLFTELQRKIPAATKLGMIEKEIRTVLDDAGLSDQTVDALFRNAFDEESFIKAEVLRLTDKKLDETSIRFFRAMGMGQREVYDVLREAWRARGYKLLNIKSGRLNRSLGDRQRRLYERYPYTETP